MIDHPVHPGLVKDRLTEAVTGVSGDERATVLAVELEDLGYDVDVAMGLRAVHFIERHCRGTKAPYYGKLVVLRPWQFVLIFTFFGCVDETGHRLFRRLWFEVAKKNGKTAMIAWLLLYCLAHESGYGAEVFAAAAAQKQAVKMYKPMASIVAQDPALRKMIKPFRGRNMLHNVKMDATFEVISADGDYNDGAIVAAAGVDEVHRHKNGAIWDVLKNGQGTTEDPCFFAITTAGAGRTGLAWDEHNHAENVINGLIEDDRLLAFIYAAPEEADWQDPAVWKLANPALGDFLREDDLAEAVAKAKSTPTEEHRIRRLRLNQWVAAETKWLDLLAWDRCAGIVDETKLKGASFYGGLDISHSQDFTAWAMLFPEEVDGQSHYKALWRFWLPEEAIVKRGTMKPTIDAWARAGYITICPGEVIDLRMVQKQILQDCTTFNLLEMGYDRFHAHSIISELMETLGDEKLADVGQTYRFLNAPCKELERLLSQGRLLTGGNPVARWMASNAVAEINQDDLVRPSRKNSADKIDGIMAALVALNRAIAYDEQDTGDFSFYIPSDEVTG